nr:uncharacterized protein LOC109156749 [Ipomoea batatas]
MLSTGNGKILSSQRSDEEQDLLERSKKKSKVRPGDPDPIAMDSVEGSEEGLDAEGSGTAVAGSMTTMETVEGLVAGVENPAMVPSDALPESPVAGSTNPSMLELADPVDSGHAAPTAMVADESLDTATVEHPSGGHVAQRRSYLDSVVGTGSNTAPFLIADPQEGDGQETCPTSPRPAVSVQTDLPNEASVQATESPVPGPNSGGRPQSLRTRPSGAPYGPWMIVSRKDRQQGGRPAGQDRNGVRPRPTGASTSAPNANAGSGSRFELLRSEGVDNGQNASTSPEQRVTEESQPSSEGRAIHTSTPSSSTGGRSSRRANVIAHEKQIVNEPAAPVSVGGGNALSSGRRLTGSGSRRAAEEDGHVVIRGEQGGNVINSTRVSNEDTMHAPMPSDDCPSQEHHDDPPNAFDEERDVLMEIEDVPECSQGVADSPPV